MVPIPIEWSFHVVPHRTDGRGDMACVGLGPMHVLLPEAVEAESADKLGEPPWLYARKQKEQERRAVHTIRKRLQAKLSGVEVELRRRMHPILKRANGFAGLFREFCDGPFDCSTIGRSSRLIPASKRTAGL
jgi:hypothetical protein